MLILTGFYLYNHFFFVVAVKRLMREAAELRKPTEHYHAQPLEDNLFEWHFTIRGSSDSIYNEGMYHGRLVFPTQYPLKPPSVIMLTPNGRFDVNTRICLSISDYHPETWQPSWSIRTALLAIITFMVTESDGAIGALDYTPAERKTLAQNSLKWKCPDCGSIRNILKERSANPAPDTEQMQKDRELAKQITFKRPTEDQSTSTSTATVSSSPVTSLPVTTVTSTTSVSGTTDSNSIAFRTRHPLINRVLCSNITLASVLIGLIGLILRRMFRTN